MKFEEIEANISLHGLGFIQVKLGGNQRLHVWHPDLPRRACFEHSSIHDHRFSFRSTVLKGTQINHVHLAYSVAGSPWPRDVSTHVAYQHEGARLPTGNRPWIPDGELFVCLLSTDIVPAGDSYTMTQYVLHSTEPGGDGRVATLMLKTAEAKRGARSLCAIGVEPDVDFDRNQMCEDDMWRYVRDVLGS